MRFVASRGAAEDLLAGRGAAAKVLNGRGHCGRDLSGRSCWPGAPRSAERKEGRCVGDPARGGPSVGDGGPVPKR